MKVFLDTNIFMEYVSCRKQYETIRDVFDAIEDGKITAVIYPHFPYHSFAERIEYT